MAGSSLCDCATWRFCLGSSACHVALFRSGTQRYLATVHEFEMGYIMGLVVGEGSFTSDRRQPCLQVKLHARDPFPLRFLADRLGGRVYGPYHHESRSYFTWLLRGPALRSALPLFREHLPESWKREQFERWLDRHRTFFAREQQPGPPVITADTER